MFFHNGSHSDAVTKRVQILCSRVNANVSERFYLSAQEQNESIISGANHDLVQNNKIETRADGTQKRLYATGENEKCSIEETLNQMQKIISDQSTNFITQSIEATIPKAFLINISTISQQLNRHSWKTNLVAMADLGAAGMEPKHFLFEGDAFLLESKPYIHKIFKTYYDGYNISKKMKQLVIQDIQSNDEFQIKMAEGEKQIFLYGYTGPAFDIQTNALLQVNISSNLRYFPDEVQQVLKEIFLGFDEAIVYCKQRQQLRKNMTFEELAKHFGFAQNITT